MDHFEGKIQESIVYRIGICDDDAAFCGQMEGYLAVYARKAGTVIVTEIFLSGEAYLEFMEKEPPLDLLFLDIKLGGADGVSVGQKLRQDILSEVTQIVYMSSEQGYAMSLFQNRPMDFLLKPVDQDTVDRVMQEYRRVYDRQNHFFEFQIGRAEHRISFGTILYFQCEGKKIHIVTCDGQRRQFYGSMKKVEEQLDRNVFCVIHKSYIVNAAYVSEFRTYEVIMVTGEALPISQPMRKKVQKWLLEVCMIKRRL